MPAKISTETHEKRLKDHVSPVVRKCIGENYRTGPIGYLIMVGGEALNHHLPKDQQVQTSDFDLKFVVAPKFTERPEDLRKANTMRLHILNRLLRCLKQVTPPKGYSQLYPRLTILKNDKVYELVIEGNRVFMLDTETGDKYPTIYRFNKVFTVKLVYQWQDEPLEEFTLIDMGLYYRLPPGEPYYNFLTNTIYNTFLYPPFSRPIPVPFDVKDYIRYPILPYILVDTYRMILFANDFLYIYRDNQDRVDFFNKKLKGYHKKLGVILDVFAKKYPKQTKELEKQIQHVIKLYEPLATLNAICYREEGKFYYTTELQELPECGKDYQASLDQFHAEYQATLEMVAALTPKYQHQRRPSRFKSRQYSKHKSRSKSRSKKRTPKKSKSRTRRKSKSRSKK